MTNLIRLFCSVLLSITLCAATAHAQRIAYYTAWPEVVPVLSPDPVLGDKRVWEHWVYTEAFAKRFKGFAPEGADPQLRGGIQAMVFRAYRRNFWNRLISDYPDQYACDLDIYFNGDIALEQDKNKPIPGNLDRYPKGIVESRLGLETVTDVDRTALASAQRVAYELKKFPITFAVPIDGRFRQLGVLEYYVDLLPGLSMIALGSGGGTCALLGPKEESGGIWLSLFGIRPFKNTSDSTLLGGISGGVLRGYREVFEPREAPEREGYFRFSDAFVDVILPKITLIKSLNECTRKKHVLLASPKNTSEWDKQQLLKTCEAIEKQGVIYDFFNKRPGWHKSGF